MIRYIVLASVVLLTGCDAQYEADLRQSINRASYECDQGLKDACDRELRLYDDLYELKQEQQK